MYFMAVIGTTQRYSGICYVDSITDYVIVTVVFHTGYLSNKYNKNKNPSTMVFSVSQSIIHSGQFCFTKSRLPYSVLKWDGIGSLVSLIKKKKNFLGQNIQRPEVEGLDTADSEWPI